MGHEEPPVGPSPRDWANAGLTLKKVESAEPEETIYEVRKTLVVNGVRHVQYVWLNQQQLRGIGIDHGL